MCMKDAWNLNTNGWSKCFCISSVNKTCKGFDFGSFKDKCEHIKRAKL